jgi:hypothetical protein
VEVRAQKLLAIGERCAQRLGPGPAAKDHGDVLYDERGLPGDPRYLRPRWRSGGQRGSGTSRSLTG